jgi:FkbM family methyltransferase
MSDIAMLDRSADSPKQAERPSDLLQEAVDAHRRGDLDTAERLYRATLQREPRNAIALNDLGIVMVQRGQRARGEELIREAVSANPDYAEARTNLGALLRERGELDQAKAEFERAIAAKPRYPDAHFNLGKVLEQKDSADEAIACFERAIACKPDHADAHFSLARLLENKGSLDLAIASFERAAASRPDNAGAHFCRGCALKAKGSTDEAIAAYRAAIAAKPNWTAPHLALGNALGEKGELDDATTAYQRALQIAPDDALTNSNFALTLIGKGEVDKAIERFRRALAVAPNAAHPHFGLSLALLQKGDFTEGWNEYEWRWKGALKEVKPREMPKPQWQGEDLLGKTLLLHAEQGIGDTLQFVRLIPRVAARGARVILEAQARLVWMLRLARVAETIVPYGSKLPDFDFHLPLLSLPAVIGLSEAEIQTQMPYLVADALRVASWRERLGKEGFKIGIVWQGNPTPPIDKGRSIPLRCFAPLAAVPGVRLISLQKNHGLDQFGKLPDGMRVETLGEDFDAGPDAFRDTAAAMVNLDLIITSDTSAAHLAGALGRPVWMVLKFSPDWRWQLEREDSPWYPTARLFRQQQRGDWDEVLQRVAAELHGVISGQPEKLFPTGRMQATADWLGRAGAAFDQGFQLHRNDRLDEAVSAYCKAITIEPNHAHAYANLGVILHGSGRLDKAIACYRRTIAIEPGHAAAYSNLAIALTAKGELDEAISACRGAIAAKPGDANNHIQLGDVLGKRGDTDGAIESYEQAIALRPDNPRGHFGLAYGWQVKGRLDQAIEGYRRTLALDPQLVAAHVNLGAVLLEKGRVDEAIAACRRAIELKPENAQYHSNLGNALREAGDINGAIVHYQQAAELEPSYAEVNVNWALALRDKGMLNAAIECNRKAIVLRPDYAEAHFNLSLLLLAAGQFVEGWQEYEWRWKGGVKELTPPQLKGPQWQGEDLTGKTLLLHAEQGLGDTLQFARFVPLLAARGARIILVVPRELVALMRWLPGVAMVVAGGEKVPNYHFHLPLMSVPAVLGTIEQDLAAQIPYLSTDPDRVRVWRDRLGPHGFKLGIVWQGRPDVKIDRGRSVPLPAFAPMASLLGIRLISLQRKHGLDQIDELPEGMTVETLGAEFDAGSDAFLDTAAVMMSLDLVITSDTSVAHLAGALGRPVWIVLKQIPDWRWQFERVDSPWYPSARLFRQRWAGDWDEVFARIAKELNPLVLGKRQPSPTETKSSAVKGAIDLSKTSSLCESTVEPSVTALKECRHGRMLILKRDNYIGKSLDAYGEFSELEVEIFSQFLKQGDVVAEVGANIGAHTVPIAKLVGQTGQVLAFEPQRVIFQILCANLVLNGLFNVRTYHAAVGREAGTITVPQIDYTAEGNFGGVSLGQWNAGEKVQLLKLDSLSLPSLRLLKVDVQGMEAEVLSGAQQIIAKHRPVLYVENDRKAQSEQLIELLDTLGYRMWWHLPKLFNPENFKNNQANLFGGTLAVNLLCFPKEVTAQITGLREVTGPADWWLNPSVPEK